jgi:recombinational DNA repair protein (RecF pathway)
MAEGIVTTEGLVVGERDSGEAAKVLNIFTRDLGLIGVNAAGIRYEKSKLRYHTQLYSLAIFTLVPGREYWRLVGAVASEREVRSMSTLARVAGLVKRFLGQGEPHPELFDSIVFGHHEDPYLSLGFMDMLGYVGREPSSREEAARLLDEAVRASHL